MNILHVDTNHPLLIQQLAKLGYINHEDVTSSKSQIETKISQYDGLIIRSRFTIDQTFLDQAINLKFIARVGAGLENIDVDYAYKMGIHLIAAPEGNCNAVGEQALGMLLSLLNKLNQADKEVRQGFWNRESNRGVELQGKTVGIIGYGHMGKAFAKKLKGFEVEVLCYDIKPHVGDDNATQVSLEEFQNSVEVVSLHTPQTPLTIGMININFINQFQRPFWLINTARGSAVNTKDLIDGIQNKKILGAGLDVLEYEKKNFENTFDNKIHQNFLDLIENEKVILTPHIAGWTHESHLKLAKIIVQKIQKDFPL